MFKKIGLIMIILCSIVFTGSVDLVEEPKAYDKEKLIRLHVLANSDSDVDQALKYKVKDAIINEIGYKFANSSSINETRKILINNLDQITAVAQNTLATLGSDYSVKAQYGSFSFPTKYYGSFSLPAGEYEAVRVVIGEGKGANWWCVLFPPICFVETDSSTQEAKQIKNGYPVETANEFKGNKIRVSFKIIEWVKDSFPIIAKVLG